MALTQLADVIIPQVFNDLPPVDSPEKTTFFESGIALRNLDAYARDAGESVTLPFWKDLDADEDPNISNDDPTALATTSKVSQGKQKAYTSHYNKVWKAADLASELSLGADAVDHIRTRVDSYWTRRWTRQIIATARGLWADNVASNDGDMTLNIAVESTASQSAATRFNRDAFVDAAYTMGDAVSNVAGIAAHSQVVAKMAKQDGGLENVYDSDGKLLYQTYNKIRLIMDDSLPVIAGTTSGFKFVSIIFGRGAFGYGEGTPRIPTEIERSALGGNGGGVESLVSRRTWLLHPYGYEAAEPADNGYTQAELANAATWTRVFDRKLVPLAFLITN